MPILILLAFILVPIAEIAVFIKAGEMIGLGWTLAVIILTAMIGTALLRQQGLKVLSQTQEKLNRGEMPVGELFTGLCLLVAGALLLTPGFITDAIGFALFLPPLRTILGYFVLRRLSRGQGARVWVNGEEVGPGTGRGPGGGPRRGPGSGPGGGPIIDGDYTDVTESPSNDKSGNGPGGSESSPWRRIE